MQLINRYSNKTNYIINRIYKIKNSLILSVILQEIRVPVKYTIPTNKTINADIPSTPKSSRIDKLLNQTIEKSN